MLAAYSWSFVASVKFDSKKAYPIEEIHWNTTLSPLDNQFKAQNGQACHN